MKALQSPDGFDQRQVASKALRDLARGLRKRQTVAEQMLWEELRDRRAGGLKFRRQYPVPDTMYVADFCCFGKRLIVELDGEIHRQQTLQDRKRQRDLEELGYRVFRFSNEQVQNDMKSVLVVIVEAAGAR